MKTVFAREPFPSDDLPSIFLAGPTPRSPDVASWRPEALTYLDLIGWEGLVFTPEDREWTPRLSYDDQVEWETEGLEKATCILFWIPRRFPEMPALTTNDEWGQWKTSGKVVLGTPPDAYKVTYQRWWAKRLDVPTADTLSGTVKLAVNKAHHSYEVRAAMNKPHSS